MAGSSQQQYFFAAGYIFADFAIAVIVYPVIKTLWIFFLLIICVLPHSDLKFKSKNQVCKYVLNYSKIQ